jgi:hypothetical protein
LPFSGSGSDTGTALFSITNNGPNAAIAGTGAQALSGGTGIAGYGGASNGASGGTGVYAVGGEGTGSIDTGGTGIASYGGNAAGAFGSGGDGIDVYGGTGSGVGGYGIYANVGTGPGALAGLFAGDVEVEGNLSKSSGTFKIDHPLDPANKYLYHSFVESPDMMNIYNGNVTTDAQGDAVVSLPEWFETLKRDFRYQLTVVGQFAQAIVAGEVAGGQFSIKTDKPNVKVSWQVTGIRQDAWANAHRIPVEVEKPEVERGFYLHPELYGAPEEKGVLWATAPQAMKQWKEARTKAAATDGSEDQAKAGSGRPQPLPTK